MVSQIMVTKIMKPQRHGKEEFDNDNIPIRLQRDGIGMLQMLVSNKSDFFYILYSSVINTDSC